MSLKFKGVSYFGVRTPKHALADMQDIKAAGFNAVLHTWSEEDQQYYYGTMAEIVDRTAELGLTVYVNPWGVGRVFGGEAYSELTARNHDLCQVALDGKPKVAACPNHPEFRTYMHHWIESVCATKVSTVFWDEPHLRREDLATGVAGVKSAAGFSALASGTKCPPNSPMTY